MHVVSNPSGLTADPMLRHGAGKFSLILCTVGRTTELVRFLEHLDRQAYRNFELVVVDQNAEGFLDPVLAPYRDRFEIVHVISRDKGLSRARNAGLARVSGDVVAFPDDDCWYPPETLERVAEAFERRPDCGGLTCRCLDETGSDAFNTFDTHSGAVTKYNVWRRSNSNGIFVTSRFAAAVREFDRKLGRGATVTTAAEEIDFLVRGIAAGFTVIYCPEIHVFHPRRAQKYDEAGARQARSDAVGQGYVLRRHRYILPYVAYVCLRPAAGMLVGLATADWRRLQYHLAILQGRIQGWLL